MGARWIGVYRRDSDGYTSASIWQERGRTLARTCVHSLDVVRLSSKVGEWPAGTEGTVVSEHADYVVVEVGDEERDDLVLLDVPRGDVRVTWRARRAART